MGIFYPRSCERHGNMHDFFSLETYGSMEYQGRKILFYVKSTFNIYWEHVNDSTWGHQFFSVKYFKFIWIVSTLPL